MRRMKSKRVKWPVGVLILALIALAYMVPAYLMSRHQEPAPVEIYFADRMTEAHRMLVARYNELHAGAVRVVPVDFPNEDFSTNERKEVLARSLRGQGDGIDVFAVDVIWVQRFARWCEPLDRYFSRDDLKRFIPEALSSCYSGDTLTAVPFDMVQGVLYYREDLLQQMKDGEKIIRELQDGITWSQLLDLKKEWNRAGPFYLFPAAEFEGLICCYMEILLAIRPDYFAANGFRFDTPEGRQALQFLVDLVQKYHAAPPSVTSLTEVPSYEQYIQRDGLFLRAWTSYNKDFSGAPYDSSRECHLRQAPLPRLDGERAASTFGGWDLMVSRSCRRKEAAVDFVKFLLSDEAQALLYANGGYYPVTAAFYDNPESVRKYPETLGIKRLMQSGVHRPAHKDYTNYSKTMAYYFVQAINNKMSVKEAALRATLAIQSEQSQVSTR